jgi:steroid delta-isomerase-like uncharacterized protein
MSLEANKTVVRRIYDELWNERRLEVADELIARGAVNYDTGLTPRPFGPEEMRATVRMVTAAFPDHRHEVEEVVAEGDAVALRCTLTGTHRGPFLGTPPTGCAIAVTEVHLYRLRDGKAVEHRVGRDDLGALRQLGVVADAIPEPGGAPPQPHPAAPARA